MMASDLCVYKYYEATFTFTLPMTFGLPCPKKSMMKEISYRSSKVAKDISFKTKGDNSLQMLWRID